jgi:limonene-1,2-epoxide hydrolase
MMTLRSWRAVLACALLALPAAGAHADTDAEKLAVTRQMFQAWHDLDWNRVIDLFAEDGVLHSMMDGPIVGRKAIGERISALGAGIERITLETLHLGIIDGLVYAERADDFVYKGRHGRVPVVGVLRIENGRVKEWREYYDRAMLLREMGIAPAPTPTN